MAVEVEAESGMTLERSYVVVIPWAGKVFITSRASSGRQVPYLSATKSSAALRWATPMPSPIKRKIYLALAFSLAVLANVGLVTNKIVNKTTINRHNFFL